MQVCINKPWARHFHNTFWNMSWQQQAYRIYDAGLVQMEGPVDYVNSLRVDVKIKSNTVHGYHSTTINC